MLAGAGPLLRLCALQGAHQRLIPPAPHVHCPSLRPRPPPPPGCRPQEAQRIGDDFLALEKFVNINYLVRAVVPWSVVCVWGGGGWGVLGGTFVCVSVRVCVCVGGGGAEGANRL